MFSYLKTAFLNRWNLLAFGGGLGVAAVTGSWDIVLPIVLAVEIGYLGMLSAHPKFQKYVDAQAAKAARSQASEATHKQLQRILDSLPREMYHQFEDLRNRCIDLQHIASDLRQPGIGDSTVGSLQDLQIDGLDRLLWIYLRLLFTKHSLGRFLDNTKADLIRADIMRLEHRREELAGDDSEHGKKMHRAVVDNLATCQDRLKNYAKAEANFEFIELEIDRLQNKIKSLAELSVNRQEHDFISSQVDMVADSMLETERTMNDLDFVTGLGQVEEQAPDLMQPPIQIIE